MIPSRLSMVAIVLAALAAIIQPFAPLWVFLIPILISAGSTAIGLLLMQRRIRREKLIEAMNAAFLSTRETGQEKRVGITGFGSF